MTTALCSCEEVVLFEVRLKDFEVFGSFLEVGDL
jgi:hypothetical protein